MKEEVDKEQLIKQQISKIVEDHTKRLTDLKSKLEIFGLKKITKQLIEQAIIDEEDIIRNLQN